MTAIDLVLLPIASLGPPSMYSLDTMFIEGLETEVTSSGSVSYWWAWLEVSWELEQMLFMEV